MDRIEGRGNVRLRSGILTGEGQKKGARVTHYTFSVIQEVIIMSIYSERIDQFVVDVQSVRKARLILLGCLTLLFTGLVVYYLSAAQGLEPSVLVRSIGKAALSFIEIAGVSYLVLVIAKTVTPFERYEHTGSRLVFLAKKTLLQAWKLVHDAVFGPYVNIRIYHDGSHELTTGRDMQYFQVYGIACSGRIYREWK
jgi:uncharacterized membrane protein YqjE